MTWTKEKAEQIPEEYRDCLLALRPIIDSQREMVQIAAVPSGQIFDALASKYNYRPQHIKTLLENLRLKDYVAQDKFGFVTLRPKGEELLRFLMAEQQPEAATVPQLPDFA